MGKTVTDSERKWSFAKLGVAFDVVYAEDFSEDRIIPASVEAAEQRRAELNRAWETVLAEAGWTDDEWLDALEQRIYANWLADSLVVGGQDVR